MLGVIRRIQGALRLPVKGFVEVVRCEGRAACGFVEGDVPGVPGDSLASLGLGDLDELGTEGLQAPDGSWWVPVSDRRVLLGLVRMGSPAGRTERRLLDELVGELTTLLEPLDPAPERLWVGHEDRWFSTEGGAPQQDLRMHARAFLRGEGPASARIHGRMVRLQRLVGEGGESVLVRELPMSRLTCPPLIRLTPMQAQVVSYAVAGATVPETARTLGRSTETVRQHLKGAYQRLGVGCRAELVHAVRWSA